MSISSATSIADALTEWGYEFIDDGKEYGAAPYYKRDNVEVRLWSLHDDESPYSVSILIKDGEGLTKRDLELDLEVWPLFAAIEIIRAVYAERNS
jgi:hypothetical protein